jgi:hypothetical protein
MTTLIDVIRGLDRRIPGNADRIDMVDAINIGLSELGYVTQMDTTLTVVDNQTEYTLPSGVYNVVRVQIATSNTDDYGYVTVYNWREVNGAIHFTDELPHTAGYTIRLYYNALHDEVEDDTDTVSDDIPLPLLIAEARYWFEQITYMDMANLGAKEESTLERLSTERLMARQRYKVNRIPRDPVLGSD